MHFFVKIGQVAWLWYYITNGRTRPSHKTILRRFRKTAQSDCYLRRVCMSVVTHLTDFNETWCLRSFLKSIEKTEVSLKSENNDGLYTDMRRLTTGLRSEKRVVRRFRRCANVYLHKPRENNTAYYTPRRFRRCVNVYLHKPREYNTAYYTPRRFRRCVNVYLHKPREYNIAYYTPRLCGITYCPLATNLYSLLLYWNL